MIFKIYKKVKNDFAWYMNLELLNLMQTSIANVSKGKTLFDPIVTNRKSIVFILFFWCYFVGLVEQISTGDDG